jgi:hypothetical protein
MIGGEYLVLDQSIYFFEARKSEDGRGGKS